MLAMLALYGEESRLYSGTPTAGSNPHAKRWRTNGSSWWEYAPKRCLMLARFWTLTAPLQVGQFPVVGLGTFGARGAAGAVGAWFGLPTRPGWFSEVR